MSAVLVEVSGKAMNGSPRWKEDGKGWCRVLLLTRLLSTVRSPSLSSLPKTGIDWGEGVDSPEHDFPFFSALCDCNSSTACRFPSTVSFVGQAGDRRASRSVKEAIIGWGEIFSLFPDNRGRLLEERDAVVTGSGVRFGVVVVR